MVRSAVKILPVLGLSLSVLSLGWAQNQTNSAYFSYTLNSLNTSGSTSVGIKFNQIDPTQYQITGITLVTDYADVSFSGIVGALRNANFDGVEIAGFQGVAQDPSGNTLGSSSTSLLSSFDIGGFGTGNLSDGPQTFTIASNQAISSSEFSQFYGTGTITLNTLLNLSDSETLFGSIYSNAATTGGITDTGTVTEELNFQLVPTAAPEAGTAVMMALPLLVMGGILVKRRA